jgi:hypothetical protein
MEDIISYTAQRTALNFKIDGDLSKEPWASAQKSPRFVDMVSGEPAFFDTRIASVYDDKALYLAYWAEESQLRASMKERDSLVWFDNDVELFIDGKDCYYELEINSFNTVYEVFFVYQKAYKRGSRWDCPEFDLLSHDMDVLCGFQDASRYKKDPRGKRWAFMDWDYPGLKTGVKLYGKINDPGTVDKGWTVEIALPWEGLKVLNPGRAWPPQAGDELRFQPFRFEALRYHGKTVSESPGWALGCHGVYDSHLPEKFSRLVFA